MYKKEDAQITIAEFISPFGKLDPTNRWVQIATMIPWRKYEERYSERFCDDNGAPAIRYRMAMGTLIIKQRTGHSDEDVLQDILENPYMQFLIGLHEFTLTAPFCSSSITNFRKYITQDMINEVNEDIFRKSNAENENDNNDDDSNGDENNDTSSNADDEKQNKDIEMKVENKGTMLIDATCAPANIAYPTDVNLLNEAREKLEGIIDTLHPYTQDKTKPRTYRLIARKKYLGFVKQRKPRKSAVRKAIGQQLRYVARDLRIIDSQLFKTGADKLSSRQQQYLQTIRTLYEQQKLMYDTRTHSVEKRIVSISQPHVRPIVRGKAKADVEFGAKVNASMVDGYAFIDKLGWEAYNEEATLIPAIEKYKEKHGFYPEAVMADTIYRNRTNRAYCKKHGIRLSGPRLGRPPKETDKDVIKQERLDVSKRNGIEGKFGEGKLKYGLDRIMAVLIDSSETVIAMSFFCMNISRKLRVLVRFFIYRREIALTRMVIIF